MSVNAPVVRGIYRYPVKGLSADALTTVNLEAGRTLPLDRAWAIENGPTSFDPEAPRHLPKIHFLMLMRDERLATFQSRFEEETETLIIFRAGKPVVRGQLSNRTGRLVIEQFLAAYMQAHLRGAPKIVSAPGHSFTDSRTPCLHLINLASVRELERVMGRPVDPLRFRPNLMLDAEEPWIEHAWVDRELAISGTRLAVKERTERCAATNVDPQTGARDMDIPAVLSRKWGHADFGIYATVSSPGTVAIGDTVAVNVRR